MSIVPASPDPLDRRSVGLGGALQARIARHALLRGGSPAIRYRHKGIWKALSWEQLERIVDLAARRFATAGVQPADKVVVVGRRTPAALVAAFAVRAAGAVPVLAPAEADAAAFARLSRMTGATAVVVENPADAARATAAGTLRLNGTIPADPADLLAEVGREGRFGVLYDAAARFAGGPAFFAVRIGVDHAVDVERVTGVTLASEIVPLLDLAAVGPADTLFALEPLSSPSSHGVLVSAWMDAGSTLVLPETDATIAADLAEAEPSAMFASARGVALVMNALGSALDQGPRWQRALVAYGLPSLADRTWPAGGRPRLQPARRLARLVAAPLLRDRVGLGRLRTCAIVGEPLTPRLSAFVAEIGLKPIAGPVTHLLGPAGSEAPSPARRASTYAALA